MLYTHTCILYTLLPIVAYLATFLGLLALGGWLAQDMRQPATDKPTQEGGVPP